MSIEKHIFAGNNTAHGFHSFFQYIIDPAEAEHIYVLKGGPGVGKNTFMKKFGTHMQAQSYDVEYIHCSSDENSLDGVRIPALNILMLDGTAPHIVDPVYPGAVDEIINLGVYINTSSLQIHRAKVIELSNACGQFYKRAFRYLKSANAILDENNAIYAATTNDNKYLALEKSVVDDIFQGVTPYDVYGDCRKLFVSAYTANGFIDYRDSLCQDKTVWVITENNKIYNHRLLQKIGEEALAKGFNVEYYYSPINAAVLENIWIPELNIVVVSNMPRATGTMIHMKEIIDVKKLHAKKIELDKNHTLFQSLLDEAFHKLHEAKITHDELEILYISNMDFAGVDLCYEQLIGKYSQGGSL